METGGDSLAAGIKNLIDDVGKGRISMTDEKAFEVGGNLAVTPGAVIFENELIQLIQYRPLTDEVSTRPLVMVPPAINKFYVFDLQPGNSFVRYAVEQGHTVFMVSWRNITADQGHLTWDDYLELGVMRAIDVAIAVTGADKANALGFCVGGMMLGCAAAVLAARGEDKIASLTFLTTMLDFSDAGEIGHAQFGGVLGWLLRVRAAGGYAVRWSFPPISRRAQDAGVRYFVVRSIDDVQNLEL